MAVAVTLDAHGFPIGTTVSAYPAENYTGGQPAGTAVAVAIVEADDDLTFVELQENKTYVAYALGRAVTFRATSTVSTSLAPYESLRVRVDKLEQVVTQGGGGGGTGEGLPQPIGAEGTVVSVVGGNPAWVTPSAASVANGSISTAKLADLAVTTGKIGDAQVTAAKVAADVATQAELDAAVAARIAADSAMDARLLDLEATPGSITIPDVTDLQAALDAKDAALATEIADRAAADALINQFISTGSGVLIETKEWFQDGSLAVGMADNPIVFNADKVVRSVRAYLIGGDATSTLTVDVHSTTDPDVSDGTTIFTTQANRPTIATGQWLGPVQIPDVTALPAGTALKIAIDGVNAGDAAKRLFVMVEVAGAGADTVTAVQPGQLAPANFNLGSITGPQVVNLTNNVYDAEIRFTLAGNVTLNLTSVPATARVSIRAVQSALNSALVIQQDGVTTTVKWENATPHVMSTASGAVDRIVGVKAATNLELSTAGKGYA